MLCDLNYICSRNNIRTLLTLRRTSALVIEIVLVLLGTLKEFSLLCIYLHAIINSYFHSASFSVCDASVMRFCAAAPYCKEGLKR